MINYFGIVSFADFKLMLKILISVFSNLNSLKFNIAVYCPAQHCILTLPNDGKLETTKLPSNKKCTTTWWWQKYFFYSIKTSLVERLKRSNPPKRTYSYLLFPLNFCGFLIKTNFPFSSLAEWKITVSKHFLFALCFLSVLRCGCIQTHYDRPNT